MKKALLFLMTAVCGWANAQKFDNLAPTPPMGWNSWNTFQTNIDEDLVKATADVMVSSGMRDAGYQYIVLDDGWMAKERDTAGFLVPDPKKFPHGMKALADYVHAKGLKFGLYNCAGTETCAGYPGTRGYEYQDALRYAQWDVDYLKFDWCNTQGVNAQEAYTTMSKALKKAGRPIVFSLCEWGSNKPWLWAQNVGQLWRATDDIGSYFLPPVVKQGQWQPHSVMTIIHQVDTLTKYAGPNHWNDPDMLEVGNGMSEAEDRSHFSMWCILAAPLIAGNDIRNMSPQTLHILTNKDAIAIDQDSLGMQGYQYKNLQDSVEVWVKPLSGNNWAVAFLNGGSAPAKINFNWKNEIVNDTIHNRILNCENHSYQLTDVWTKNNLGTTEKIITSSILPHDILLLKLSY